jgi:hypothetical protein
MTGGRLPLRASACLAAAFALLGALLGAPPAHATPACTALVIYDQLGAQTTALQTALTDAGAAVTLSGAPEYQYNGANPAPGDFSEVIHLDGSTQLQDMPTAGQTALVSYVQSGGTFVGGEWAAYEHSQGRLQSMQNLILFDRQGGSSGTATLDVSAPNDPLVAGLAPSFQVQAGWNKGPLHLFTAQPSTVLAKNGGDPALARRSFGQGTVIGFGIDLGSYGSFPTMQDEDVQRIVTNSLPAACAIKARITAKPASVTSARSAAFDFTSSDPDATFACKIDGGAESACAPPKTYANLAEGTHSFAVVAIAANGTRSVPATFVWRVDLTSPDTTITSGPPALTNKQPTFAFSSSKPSSTFLCAMDGATPAACATPARPSVSEGAHTFTVAAVDQAGNVDPTPASASFRLDQTPPQTTITAHPAAQSNVRAPSFEFSASDDATFACALDGAPASACQSPVSVSVGEGSHTFSVVATDLAGNADPSPASYTWRVDLTPPDTALGAKPYPVTSGSDPTFTFSSSEDGSTFACALDGASFAPCASPLQYQGLAEGTHVFKVRATDAAGNDDQSPASVQWTIDLNAPDVTITAPVEGYVYYGEEQEARPPFNYSNLVMPGTFHVKANVSDLTAVTVVVSVDGAALCTMKKAPFSCAWTPEPRSGSHRIEVAATDAVGHRTAQHVDANVI